ncbi:MAG: lysine--tRNA ligase [Thermoplasmata archaeon]
MSDETPLEHERRQKVERARADGREPYPWSFVGRVPTSEVRATCARLAPGAEDVEHPARVAGRVLATRVHGKTAFADLEDRSGSLQLLLRADSMGGGEFRTALAELDPGDLVGAEGAPAMSKRGEPSLHVRALTLLAKAIAPPPEKYHGLKDPEERLRRRYLDLLASEETRALFRARSGLIREIRRYLDAAQFLEVETPILLPVASGASATPFVAHSRYLDADLQLRIAQELPLKRLLVGGLERVYELGRTFRNEDMDTTHSPEFTELEAYWAYADYHDMRRLIEGLFRHLAETVRELLPNSAAAQQGARDFTPPFVTIDFVDELERRSGIPDLLAKNPDELRSLARAAGSTVPDASTPGTFLDKLFEHYVEPHIDRMTFVVDHPAATTPLAKRHRSKPGRVERFEIYFRGFELGNAYTELNDPDEQERRFREQLANRGADAYAYDEDFVRALRHGMPPATGIGLGVDRLIMGLTGTPSIKDVILFPLVRPR